jgi:hypothetical protein
MLKTAITALMAFAVSTPSWAQSVTLTADDGRPLIVGGETELGAGLQPTNVGTEAIAGAFEAICLPDPEGADARADGSELNLTSEDAVLPASGRLGEARIAQWLGASTALSLWTGDEANLRGRPIAMPSRGATTTGPYGPFRARGAQCNLVIALTDMAMATQLAEALTARLGTPARLVSRRTFADGHWIVRGADRDIRINFTAPSVRGGAQPVHLSAQALEKGSNR